MAVYSIYFSPTGGTEKVMKLLASAWESVMIIDLSVPEADYGDYNFSEKDVCLIGIPVFEGRVPKIVLERISHMKANNTPAVLVAVYGNRDFNDALLELKNELMPMGFRPVAAVSTVAHHSSLPMYAEGRPDQQDAEELKSFSAQLKEIVEAGKSEPVEVPGNEPYIEISMPPNYPLFDREKCIDCKACAEKCPVQAIDRDTLELNQDRCARCVRCVYVCPAGARYLDPARQQAAAQRLAKLFEGRKPNVLYQ